MTYIDTNEHELFLTALEVEEVCDTDYISVLYLPTFHSPIYACIELCTPCRVKLHIPIDEWGGKEDLSTFKHYWKTEGNCSEQFSSGVIRDVYRLRSKKLVDYYDPYIRDGFAVYCKGTLKGQSFNFFLTIRV